jgi:acyl-CoA thioesterase-2
LGGAGDQGLMVVERIDAAAALVDLQPVGGGRYEARNLGEGHGGVVVGGQMLAQALVAATRMVPDKEVLSIHAVFARGAAPERPLQLDVDVMHAGRSFASATVTVSQDGRICARSTVLLHEPDTDLIRHADPFPAVAPAEALPASAPGTEGREVRVVDGVDINDSAVGPAELRLWTRFPGAPQDVVTSQALLAYVGSEFLIGTAMRPHEGIGQSMAHLSVSTTVLTHTVSFHEPFNAGEWLLLDHRSSYAGRGRSQGDASVFAADGRLVATLSQVNMIRGFPAGHAPKGDTRAKY